MRNLCLTLDALFALSIAFPIHDAEAGSSRGGHYAGGKGSSHKGGHYVNPRTGNHYTKRR